jgi:perosamine synthetase
MEAILQIANRHKIKIVEDAAPAIGATIGSKAVGTFGNIGCYSFQGAKLLVTGEGGMVVTDDDELFAKVKKLQDHGRKPGTFWIEELGYKYKMSNITAALGLAQIQRADNQIFRKRRIRGWYEDGLSNVDGISFQEEIPGTNPIHWMTSIRLTSGNKHSAEALMQNLSENGVDTRPVFPAISRYEFWPDINKESAGENAQLIADHSINLPSGVGLSKESVDYVCDKVARFLESE